MMRLRFLRDPQMQRALALAAWIWLLFAGSLDHGFFYDDAHSILDNDRLRDWRQIPGYFVDPGAFSALPEARMYRPLLLSTYALNFALPGSAGVGFHLANLLFHLVACLLLQRLARKTGMSEGRSWALAILLATHPLVTEPVNYVSSRSASLSAIFILAALLALIGRDQKGYNLPLATAMLAAVLTKATGLVVLPLAVLYLMLTRQFHRWRELVAPALVGTAYTIGTRSIIGKALGEPLRNAVSQVATQIKALSFYLQTLLMPTRLSIEPQFSISTQLTEPAVVMSAAFVLSLGFIVAVRGRWLEVFGVGWFFVALAPTSIVPLHVLVNEHRLYAAMPGLLLATGAALSTVRWRSVLLAALIPLLAILTLQRNGEWATAESIWESAIRRGPLMARSHINLGKVLLEAGDYTGAVSATQRGLLLDPGQALGHYNIATAFLHMGRFEQAVAGFERALEIDPTMSSAWNNLGNVYKELGRWRLATTSYHRALQLTRRGPIYHNLGSTYLAAADYDSAAHYFTAALQTDPENRESHIGLARALRKAGQLQASATSLQRALEHWPGDAQLLSLLAHTQAALGAHEQAVATFRRTGRSVADIRLELGQASLARRDTMRARIHIEAGLRAAPDDARLHNAQGEVLLITGDRPAALDCFRRAAQLDPGLSVAYRNIGLVNLRYRRWVEAQAALERSLSLEADGSQTSDGRTWELLAHVHEGAGRLPEAMAAYEQALLQAPGRAVLHHNLGVIQERLGALAAAERSYRQALRRDASLHEAQHSLGHLLLATNRAAESVPWLEAAAAGRPEATQMQLNLAAAYTQVGRTEMAISVYEKILALENTAVDVRQSVRAQLRRLHKAIEERQTSH